MQEDELLAINVWLSGRSYRIRIKPEEEEAVRKAVKIADEKVMEMRALYTGKDDQDYIAMTLLTYAGDSAMTAMNNPFLKSELKGMADRIDNALNKLD
ncbi:MAG TPA: cell division protein ZapA [Flavipsychrobacter sp.]|nr:cell division protein ZapA [Flavipsychrobacter sp.]